MKIKQLKMSNTNGQDEVPTNGTATVKRPYIAMGFEGSANKLAIGIVDEFGNVCFNFQNTQF